MQKITARVLWAGVAATVVMTAMMMFVAPMMGIHMDIAASLAGMMHMPWILGLIVHLMLGAIVFPMLFAMMVEERLPGNVLMKGILFGAILWLVMEFAVMPMMGEGFLGLNGPGMIGAVAALIVHLVYGAILGFEAADRSATVVSRAV